MNGLLMGLSLGIIISSSPQSPISPKVSFALALTMKLPS
jgi:hypothetical protein